MTEREKAPPSDGMLAIWQEDAAKVRRWMGSAKSTYDRRILDVCKAVDVLCAEVTRLRAPAIEGEAVRFEYRVRVQIDEREQPDWLEWTGENGMGEPFTRERRDSIASRYDPAHVETRDLFTHPAPATVTEDTRILDALEDMIRGSAENGWCEVYLSGLRHGVAAADRFQCETNPNHLGTTVGRTLREAIVATLGEKMTNKSVVVTEAMVQACIDYELSTYSRPTFAPIVLEQAREFYRGVLTAALGGAR